MRFHFSLRDFTFVCPTYVTFCPMFSIFTRNFIVKSLPLMTLFIASKNSTHPFSVRCFPCFCMPPKLTIHPGISTDSKYSHFAWATQTRKEGGLGPDLHLPLIADRNMAISRDYGVLLEDEGIALRGLFIIDPKGILRQITVNDLPVGRSVEETVRLIQAFQFTVRYSFLVQLFFYSTLFHFHRTLTVKYALRIGLKALRPSRPTRSINLSSLALPTVLTMVLPMDM
jgi:hypothetical protein